MSTTGGVGRERGYTILIVLLVVSIGFAAVDFVLLNLKNGEDRQAIALTTQIQVLSQQTAKYALEASGGNPDSFAELENARDTIDSAVQRLVAGDTKTGMKAYADKGATQHGPLRQQAGRRVEIARWRHRQDPLQQGSRCSIRRSALTISPSSCRCSTPTWSR